MSLEDINKKSCSSSRGSGSGPGPGPARRPQNHRGNNRSTPYSTNTTKELFSEVGDMKRQQTQENDSAQEQKRKKRQLYGARLQEIWRVRDEERKKRYDAWLSMPEKEPEARRRECVLLCSIFQEKMKELWIIENQSRNQLKTRFGVTNQVKLEEVKVEKVKLEEVKVEKVKLEEVKVEKVKLDEVKVEKVKLEVA